MFTKFLGLIFAFPFAVVLSFVGIKTVKPLFKSEASHSVILPDVVQTPIASTAFQPPSKAAMELEKPDNATEIVVLNSRNTIGFRGEVEPMKVAHLQLKLMAMSRNLSPNDVIYLVLDTPGGDITSGSQFIDTARSLPQKVKTITVFAASMGFHIVQALDERLILPSGILMSHRARLRGAGGELPGELLVRINFWLKQLQRLDLTAASRMQMPFDQYQELIRDEYWIGGADSVAEKAADRLVLARCDESLTGTTREHLGVFFGVPIYGIMSECPVVSGILDVELGQSTASDEDKSKALNLARSYYQRETMVNYIISEKMKP